MAADSSRGRERPAAPDGEAPADEQAARDGETLAEKIHRFRQPAPGAPGNALGPRGRVLRNRREE